jgi:hypothetical protein
MGVGGLVGLIIILLVLSGGGTSNNAVVNNSDGEAVMAYYSRDILAIRNMSKNTLDLTSLVIGDIDGDDIRDKTLAPNECLLIKNQNQPANPQSAWGCNTISGEILRASDTLVWRSNFQIKSGSNTVANCNAVGSGGTSECSFSWRVIIE